MNTGKEKRTEQNMISKLFFTMMLACLLFMAGQTACFASTVVLQWDPNTDTDLAGYKVYYNADSSTQPFQGTGATQGATPVDIHNQTTATISGLDPAHPYYFAVTAYNTAGVESVYSNIVSVPELVSPTVSLSSPANNASISGTVSVTASASDNVGVTKVEFYVNGALQATDTSTPYLYSWNTTSLAAGSYALMAKAYDAAGNVGQTSNVTVNVVNDSTAPTVSVTAPANNATVSGTTTITASASDNVGVSKVEFYEDGALLSASNVAPYSYSWNTTSVANGSHNLTAKAYDATNNIGQSGNITVTVSNSVTDTTAPTVSVTTPVNNSTVSGTISVTTTASDNVGVSKVEFYVNNVIKATDTASPYSFSWNTTSIANGTYTLTAKAYDAAGNVGQSSTVTVTVNNPDTSAPTVTAFTLPATSATLTVPVSLFTATDNIGVTNFCVTTTNSSAGCSWSGTAPSSVTFGSAGIQTAWAWARDAAGNISAGVNAATTITLAGSSSITIGETGILSGDDSGNGNLLLSQSATLGQTATIQSLSFYVNTASGNLRLGIYDAAGTNGGPGNLIASTAEITPINGWNTANVTTPVSLSAGTYWLAFLPSSSSLHCSHTYATGVATWYSYAYGAIPAAYPATQDTMTAHWSFYATLVTADIIAPTVSITAPASNATVNGTVSVTATASDNVGVSKVEFYVNNVLQTTDTASPYTFSWNTTALANGSYTLSTKAYDAVGNVGQSSNVTVTVNNPDTTAPTVSITAPASNATVNGTVSVTATASDNVGVSKVEFYVNNVLQATTASAPFSFSWNTTALANGSYTLSAKAYDVANNIGQSSTVTVTVNNPDTIAPTVSITAPANNATVSGVVSVTATASDNVGVSKVEFYVNNVLQTTTTSAPFSFSWNTAALANGSYTLSAKAYDAAGNVGQSSSTVSVVTVLLVAPSNLTATTATATSIKLSWMDNSNNETGFAVWRSINGAAATLVTTVTRTAALGTATGGTVTYTNTGLAAGNTYAYFVTAVNATGPSIASNTVSVVFAAPAAPSNLAGAAVRINGNTTKDSVTLNWTDNSTNETLFTIQRATNAAFTAGVASYTVAANAITFSQNDTRRTTITTPPSNGYYFRVRATNLLGNSTWTPGLFVTTP
jgi:hypothetical protein